MGEAVYRCRWSTFSSERTYALTGDALRYEQAGKLRKQIALSDIGSIRIWVAPVMGPDLSQCAVRGRGGEKIKLKSQHYISLGNFEDRTDTYAPFVTQLVEDAAAASPQAKFRAGSTAFWITWLVLLVLITLVGVLYLVTLLDGEGLDMHALIPLAVVGFSAPMAVRAVRRGGTKPFDPHKIPPEILGVDAPVSQPAGTKF